jgi:hypothetical protein
MSEPERTDRRNTVSIADREIQPATLLLAGGLGWLVVVGWLLGGVVGGAVGVAIAGIAVVARPVVVVGIAHAGLVVVSPELTTIDSLATVGLFELGVIAVLFSDPPIEIPTALLTAGFAIVLTTITLTIWLRNGPGVAVGVLFAVVALLGYGIHRYERVSLGLVATETDTHGDPNE